MTMLAIINLSGLLAAVVTFLAIGLGFWWVIKLEYHVGAKVAWAVAVVGLLVTAASAFVPNLYGAALLGILGGTIIWGATELPEQEKRVKRGQFPQNPKRSGQ